MTKPRFLDYFLVALQFSLFGLYLWPVSWPYALPDMVLWPAQLAMIVGLILLFAALGQIGFKISPFPRPKENTVLISWGVFGIVRHPIYSGIILFAVGMGLYQEDLYKLFISFLLFVLFYFKSSYEERNMRKFFPEYKDYQKRVGRFFPKVLRGTKP